MSLEYGDIVRVRNTMLYNGRVGMLGPISSDPEDPWDYYVTLEPDGRTIAVHSYQVESA